MDSSGEIDLNLQPSVQQNSPDHDQTENQQGGDVMEVVSRIYSDNRKLTRMVAEVLQNYTSLHSHLVQYFIASDQKDPQLRKKRKWAEHLDTNLDHDDGNIYAKTMRCSCSGSDEERLRMLNSKPKVSTVFVRVDSSDSSLVVKDGYQWKKYGQKVTRDNPSPRAYFKCSFAPLCPVKKKVQKSAEDRTVLVVTYEGEHTHKKPSSNGSILKPSTIIPPSSSPPINLSPWSHRISSPDHLIRPNTKEKDSDEDSSMIDDQERSSMHRWLVEQMASSLTKDSSFASTLATIISDKVLEQTFC